MHIKISFLQNKKKGLKGAMIKTAEIKHSYLFMLILAIKKL